MSQLTKSLEKRIQELTASIDAQKIELAAYQRVLHLESSKGIVPSESDSVVGEAPSAASASETEPEETESAPAAAPASEVSFKGNKTAMVADIVKTYGSLGASPKDVDAFFTSKNIPRSKNLVYNTLSYLVARKQLSRRDGKYFANGSGPAPTGKKRGPKPGKKATAAVATKTKRRLSPEGLKRIREALKKRWADKRAAGAVTSRPAKKKAKA